MGRNIMYPEQHKNQPQFTQWGIFTKVLPVSVRVEKKCMRNTVFPVYEKERAFPSDRNISGYIYCQ